MARGGGGGRIHVHQRETDDTVPIIGTDIAIKENHAAAAQTTQLVERHERQDTQRTQESSHAPDNVL